MQQTQNVETEGIQKVHKWQECVPPSLTFVGRSKSNVIYFVDFEIGNTAQPHWYVLIGEGYSSLCTKFGAISSSFVSLILVSLCQKVATDLPSVKYGLLSNF